MKPDNTLPAGTYPQPSDAMILACAEALAYEALAETIRPEIERIRRKAFKRYKFYNSHTRERLNDPEHIYMTDQDEDVRKYFDDCNRAIAAAGYTVEWDYCPLLMAESRKMEAEKLLIKAQWELLERHGLIGDAAAMYDGTTLNNELFRKAVDLGKRFTATFIPDTVIEDIKRDALKAIRG